MNKNFDFIPDGDNDPKAEYITFPNKIYYAIYPQWVENGKFLQITVDAQTNSPERLCSVMGEKMVIKIAKEKIDSITESSLLCKFEQKAVYLVFTIE